MKISPAVAFRLTDNPPNRMTLDPELEDTIQYSCSATNPCGPLKFNHPVDGVYLYISALNT
jgi:hypothetical protein